jgi:hypothetical protein
VRHEVASRQKGKFEAVNIQIIDDLANARHRQEQRRIGEELRYRPPDRISVLPGELVVVRQQEVDLLLGHDDRHRPLTQLLPAASRVPCLSSALSHCAETPLHFCNTVSESPLLNALVLAQENDHHS